MVKSHPAVIGEAIYQMLFDASLYFEIPMPHHLNPNSIHCFVDQVSDYVCNHINDIHWSDPVREVHSDLLHLQAQIIKTGWRQSLGWIYPPAWQLIAAIRCADHYRQLVIRLVTAVPV